MPREVFESAAIDGASPSTSFFRLALPMSVPALASLIIFQFLWVWNDLLVALVYLGGASENHPLSVVLANLTTSFGGGWQFLTAAAFVSMIVPIIVFVSPPALLRSRHHRRCRQGLTGRTGPGAAGGAPPPPSRAALVRARQRASRSRSRSTWSASSASLARAPSTTCGGALARKPSLDEPSARRGQAVLGLGQLLLETGPLERSAAAPSPPSAPPAGAAGPRVSPASTVSAPGVVGQGLAGQAALERAGAGQPLDTAGRSASNVAPSAAGRATSSGQPGRRLEARLGARVAQAADELEDGVDLGLGARVALARPRASGRR